MGDGADWGANFSGSGMARYEESLVRPLFIPWAEHLLEKVGVGPGDSVLDVACGPGTVARLAAERVGSSGSVVGCDLSEEMLSIARAKGDAGGQSIDYRHCPADALSVEDGSFDAAVCQEGLQFFPDRVAALRELNRALVEGGRVGVSVWCEIESCAPFVALETAIAEVLGSEAAVSYRSGPWGLAGAQPLEEELIAAGFSDVRLSRDEITVTFDGIDHLIDTLGAAPIAAQVRELDAGGRRDLRRAVENSTSALIDDGALRGVTTCHTATGTA
jgi:SAM-dependent methyltransferase